MEWVGWVAEAIETRSLDYLVIIIWLPQSPVKGKLLLEVACRKLKIGGWWGEIAQENPQLKENGNYGFDKILTVHMCVLVISCCIDCFLTSCG